MANNDLKVGDKVLVDHRLLDLQGLPRHLGFPRPATVSRVIHARAVEVLDVNGTGWVFNGAMQGFPEKVEEEDPEEEDPVDHPPHYNQLGVECIQVIEELYADDYLLGNAMKYLWRAKYKGKFAEDLKKCVWYLQRRISALESEE